MNEPNGVQWIDGMREVDRSSWNRLADQYESPLMDWEWLSILEESGSVTEREGWIPQHLLYYENGTLVGAAPLYVKTHSVGEFVFDYAWAEVAQQLGASYYPKLVAMSPLTPAIGYRFLIDQKADVQNVLRSMLEEIDRFVRANQLQSFSILWPEPDFERAVRNASELTFTPWQHQHFRWENESFTTFDDYLAVFKKNQRRNIKRERRSMEDQGIRLETIFASEAPASFARSMFRYYSNTNDQFGMWAARYLTPDFFEMIKDGPGHRVVYSAAFEQRSESPIGMSMLLYKPDRLIGRYWGAERFVDNLHFNLC
ncbi:MAG: peptidogalycan biosysnthesis protein, partial [Spirochaetales bacterium]